MEYLEQESSQEEVDEAPPMGKRFYSTWSYCNDTTCPRLGELVLSSQPNILEKN